MGSFSRRDNFCGQEKKLLSSRNSSFFKVKWRGLISAKTPESTENDISNRYGKGFAVAEKFRLSGCEENEISKGQRICEVPGEKKQSREGLPHQIRHSDKR